MQYLEIPYATNKQGFDGADCWGFVLLYYENEFGVKLDNYKDLPERYKDPKETSMFLEYSDDQFNRIDDSDLQKGDCLLICTNSVTPNHIAIYKGAGMIIHMNDPVGVIVSRYTDWKDRVYSIHRYKEPSWI